MKNDIRHIIIFLAWLWVYIAPNEALYAQDMEVAPHEWIVCVEDDDFLEKDLHNIKQQYFSDVYLTIKDTISSRLGLYLLHAPLSKSGEVVFTNILQKHPAIRYFQRNHRVEARNVLPNDPYLSEQWSLEKTGITEVWQHSNGGTTPMGDTIVVGIIDFGFEHRHEDLYPNVWVNQAEIPDDYIDNDQNGYVDDYYGWNFRFENDHHDQKPNNGVDHGTAVAGIVGAVGDNARGIAGVNWNVKMMLLSVLGFEADIAKAYTYMLEQRLLYNQTRGSEGAFVVVSSISLGYKQRFPDEAPLWCDVYDALGAVGIINVGATANEHYDVDTQGDIPTSCPSDFLIAVTNTNETDRLEYHAGYGVQSIDLAAPGTGTFSTNENNTYRLFGGTSAATPHVAGTIALLYTMPCADFYKNTFSNPSQMALDMKQLVLQNVDKLPDLEGKTLSGGRLNALRMLHTVRDTCGGVQEMLRIGLGRNPVPKEEAMIAMTYGTTDFGEHEVCVYNQIGQLMYQTTFRPPDFAEKQLQIPNRFQKGLYFVTIKSRLTGRLQTTSFVVE